MTVQPFAGPFADDASVLDRLEVGEPLTVIEDGEVTIQLEALSADNFFISVASGPPAERGDPESTMHYRCRSRRSARSARPDRDGRGLTIGMVPDSVATVTDASGRPLPMAENVFYDIGTDTQHTYLIASADGTESQVLRDGWVTVSLGQGPL